MIDYKNAFETMVRLTAQYLTDNHLKTMVLGLSGGIDSTVTAAICHEVTRLDPEKGFKFIGVSLPCSTNSNEENDSALMAMKGFCDEWWVENLQKEYLLMRATCEQRYASTQLSQGNIKARLRMIYLGFWTIHGDVADYNPIGGLWKHEVYELCKYLFTEVFPDQNDPRYKALKAAYDITPTDGNGVAAGGDMAQIAPGHTYEEVDDILNSYLQSKDDADKLQQELNRMNAAYGAETVERVLKRHRGSEFKRKRMPLLIERSLYEK